VVLIIVWVPLTVKLPPTVALPLNDSVVADTAVADTVVAVATPVTFAPYGKVGAPVPTLLVKLFALTLDIILLCF